MSTIGTPIKFVKSGRFDEYSKGDIGKIEMVLATKPLAQDDIFIVSVNGRRVWTTGKDLIPWYQLSLWDDAPTTVALPTATNG